MIIGIECTAHTLGIGIVHNKKILANEKDMYKTISGGIIPLESAKHHHAVIEKIYKQALNTAQIDEHKIKALAVSNAPGLAPCLLAGMKFAKKKAKELCVSLIPVNHCIAHLEIGQSIGAKDPVLLYVSGANTQIIAYAAGKYRIFGETLDIGIGNMLDKFARHNGYGFPGGPLIEKLAKQAKEANMPYAELPYVVKGMDVSFSGLLTKAQQLTVQGMNMETVSFSLQETAFAMLVEAAERAMAHTTKKELVLGGGVACNSRLQQMCQTMCKERKAKFFCPSKDLLIDNGAMIAYTGELMYNTGISSKPDTVDIKPRERTDDVAVSWRK